ncbi:hypothetical protein QQP08_013643 [Theobroma cacao]|nr:hypothetical protein QQP08_013643 [Theobroma cacao]
MLVANPSHKRKILACSGSGLITDYILSESYFTVNTTVPLNYAMIPKYTAPEEVYQTARTMGPDGDYNKKTQHNMGIARGFRIHVYGKASFLRISGCDKFSGNKTVPDLYKQSDG